MRYDLIIREARIVTPDDQGESHAGERETTTAGGDAVAVAPSSLAARDGKIVKISPEIGGTAALEIDASGLYLLPGLIDPHVHFNEPGRTEWEGIASGSAALAAGGGTCYFDMPLNSSPPLLDGAAFDAKLAAASRSSLTDFGLWGGLVPGNLDRLDELAERGVIGFKAFMCDSGIDEFPAIDDSSLEKGMAGAARLNLPVAVHAESPTITRDLARRATAAGRTGIRDYLQSRPIEAELEAMLRAISLAAYTRCSLHIVHVSCGRGVAMIAQARASGIDVTCETCPHYLFLTQDDLERLGAIAKCAPPLRTPTDQADLWSHLLAGRVLFVASDHSPAPWSMKASPDFFKVWGGIAGCQTTLGLLLADHGGLSLGQIAWLTSTAAAGRFRVEGKGALRVGYDADLTLVNPAAGARLAAEHLHYRHKISPFLGRPVQGIVHSTFVRGRRVFESDRIIAPPFGQFVRPRPSPEP